MFGSFAEHMGRVIYSGIYEPGHPQADVHGFRMDVMKAVQDMGVSCMRYPGGNFVSNYDWRDGIGPVRERPHRLELAWRSIETNEFGTNEFLRWAEMAQTEPILAINLGTRGIEDAVRYLEYVNFPAGSQYSDLRREHGFEKPYGVKLWCLGNEMDGDWQIGHKTAVEYGRLAAETGKAMKLVDPGIELIACGSSKSDMDTHPQWDMTVLEHVYGIADYLALHQYYGGQEKGIAGFLAQSADFETYIQAARSCITVAKQKLRSKAAMYISVDEWGVWPKAPETVALELDQAQWQTAPAISEQIYTLEDALLFASMLMAMVRNADIVKIACQSLVANISACIMTERGGGLWKQTIYYPFQWMAQYARGSILQTVVDIPAYDAAGITVPVVDSLLIWNRERSQIIVFAVNRHDTEKAQISCTLQQFDPKAVLENTTLFATERNQTNQHCHQAVVPRKNGEALLKGDTLTVECEPLSFTMVRVQV